MGFAKTNFDIAGIIGRIENLQQKATRNAADILREERDEIRRLAGEFAPRDDGTLEEFDSFYQEDFKNNRRIGYTIELNPHKTDEKGRKIAVYGRVMHEQLLPHGSGPFHLGEGSERKAESQVSLNSRAGMGADGSGRVGGKFLLRAFLARRGIIGKRLAEAARAQFGGGVAVSRKGNG